MKQLIQDAHTRLNENDIDELIKVVGNYVRNEIKSAEKHKDVLPEASDMKSVAHNLSISYLPHCVFFYRQSSKEKCQISDVLQLANPS